jgi:hypothetical protein
MSAVVVGLITVATISAVVTHQNAPIIIRGLGDAFRNLVANATQAGTDPLAK